MRTAFLPALCLTGALGATSCATTPWARVDDPPLSVTISVVGLKPDERALLREQVCALPDVKDCALTEKKGEARLSFSYRGSLGALRHRIASLPHPGLEPKSADASLAYRGFDNKAPSIEVVAPLADEVVAARSAVVAVVVSDPDTARVTIGGGEAKRQEGGRYAATVPLQEGDNDVAIEAQDDAGNEARATARVVVDTMPPELVVEIAPQGFDAATVKGKAQGHVRLLVDGKEVATDLFGAFSVDVRVDPDKRTVVVEALDAHGNAKTIRRSLSQPSGPSSD